MKLNLILPTRTLNLNGKEIKIPKLGLKHHKLVKDPKPGDESLRMLIDSIHPGLDGAEQEMVLVYLAAFNGRCNETKTVGDFTYDISTIKVIRKTEFSIGDEVYTFRSPNFGETFISAKDILNSTGSQDFGQMPAYVANWAEQIISTIQMDGPDGPISGCGAILGILE
ncbi:baseplate hub distal subunit [Serratia phage 92A1]|nr:baseplate hub distal subunit [Serratia phage 92A1]